MTRHMGIVAEATALLEPLRFAYDALPLKDAIDQYRDEGVPQGDFLTALLSGDYKAALAHADDTNRWLLPVYHAYLYNEMPRNRHGSREAVAAWTALCREQRVAQDAAGDES